MSIFVRNTGRFAVSKAATERAVLLLWCGSISAAQAFIGFLAVRSTASVPFGADFEIGLSNPAKI